MRSRFWPSKGHLYGLGPAAALCAGVGLAAASGCEAKFAQRLVAPTLLDHPAIERGRTRPKMEIGPYVVEELERSGGTGRLQLEVRRADQRLELKCDSTRSVPGDADLAAVSGRPTTGVTLRCTVSAPSGDYVLAMQGRMSENLRAEVQGPGGVVVAQLELVLFYSVFETSIRREAPTPIAQAYIEDVPVAAMVLSRPERTWFDPNTGPVARDVLFAFMLGMRFAPGLLED